MTDESRIEFLRFHACDLDDLTEREAKLIDDVSENGPRELTSFERSLTDRMSQRYAQHKKGFRR